MLNVLAWCVVYRNPNVTHKARETLHKRRTPQTARGLALQLWSLQLVSHVSKERSSQCQATASPMRRTHQQPQKAHALLHHHALTRSRPRTRSVTLRRLVVTQCQNTSTDRLQRAEAAQIYPNWCVLFPVMNLERLRMFPYWFLTGTSIRHQAS